MIPYLPLVDFISHCVELFLQLPLPLFRSFNVLLHLSLQLPAGGLKVRKLRLQLFILSFVMSQFISVRTARMLPFGRWLIDGRHLLALGRGPVAKKTSGRRVSSKIGESQYRLYTRLSCPADRSSPSQRLIGCVVARCQQPCVLIRAPRRGGDARD